MPASVAEMTYDQLMQHKLKLFHLHRDYSLSLAATKSPSSVHSLEVKLSYVSRQIDRVISELSRRNPAKNPTLQ